MIKKQTLYQGICNKCEELEKKIKDIKILKLKIEEQRQTVASTQETADKEYQKLKLMEKDLLKAIDDQVRLEKEQKNDRTRNY